MKRLVSIILASIVLMAAGCTMAPKYVRPKAEVPPDWPTGVAYPDSLAPAGQPAAATVSAADFYPDPRMQEVVATALVHNLDLKLAALNVAKVQAAYHIKRAELVPPIGVRGAGSSSQLLSYFGTGQTFIDRRYTVDLGISAWELDLFGRVRSEKNQALELFLASAEGRRSAELSLVAGVGQAYLSLAATREQLDLARSTLKTQQDLFDLVTNQYDAGAASALDLQRARTQVSTAKVNVAGLTRQEAQDRNALNLLEGGAVPDDLLPSGLADVTPPLDIAPGLSSDVLLRRPDIMAAEHQLEAANAFLGVARAAFFPRISLTALVGTASTALSGLFGATRGDTWSFQSQATMPIFDLRTHGALKVSQADRDIALTTYQKTIQTAFREVADALAAKGTLDDQVAAQADLVDAATVAFHLANSRYEAGADSYLSVLDAQRSLYAAQQGLVGLRLAAATNKVELYKVLGGEMREGG